MHLLKSIAPLIGLLALVGTILPPILVLLNRIEPEPMKNIMLISCLAWFLTAPQWMNIPSAWSRKASSFSGLLRFAPAAAASSATF